MSEALKNEILLDSGTNELEVIMFEVDGNTFGINVLKVREIIQPLPVTAPPNSHSHIEGVISLRQEVIPVVNLAKVLQLGEPNTAKQDKFIIAELNKMKVAFHVHNVSRIHRVSWEQIDKPSELAQGNESHTIGIIKLDDVMALLLDFEKIVVDINPEVGLKTEAIKTLGVRERSDKRIVVAEDSSVLRKLLKDTLTEAGYENLMFFDDGKEAWNYLKTIAERGHQPGSATVDAVITDIEMPQMDGHHLTVKIKENPVLQALPVVIFSSLISEELFHKGEGIGADAQISKPDIVELVQTIDQLISLKTNP